MATVMVMRWPQVTKEQYEQVRREVNWEGDVPGGAKFHVAWFDDEGLRVIDLWDSREACESFMQNRLTPGVQNAGIQGEPAVEFAPTHAIFAPNP